MIAFLWLTFRLPSLQNCPFVSVSQKDLVFPLSSVFRLHNYRKHGDLCGRQGEHSP